MALWWIIGLLIVPCSGQLLNDTYGGISTEVQQTSSKAAEWNLLKRYSMYYGTSAVTKGVADTALSTVPNSSGYSLSSRMTTGFVGGVKFVINIFRLIGEFLRKFGAELRLAKCLLMYTFTYQPFSSKVAGGSILNWLTGYFGAEDARDLYRFLSRNVFTQLGLMPDA